MEKYIISISNVEIKPDVLISTLKLSDDDDFIEDAIKIMQEAVKIAKPTAIYTLLTPDLRNGELWLNNVKLEEPFVFKMLSPCDPVVPYVATCGLEIDSWSKKYTDLLEQFTADTLKQLCLGLIIEKLFNEVKTVHFNSEKNISTLNPGSIKEWPISGQKPLFKLLGGVTNDIGVKLSESLLMSPTKSVSGIIFQSEEEYHNCQLCPRPECQNRRAPYAGD